MRLASLDIGTNSIHMVIVEARGRGGVQVIDRDKAMVKLGAGLFESGGLTERAFAEGIDVVRRYVKLAQSRGVDEILAVATSATREAENGGAFVDEIRRQTGVSPKVISGFEEARLIFLAVRRSLDLAQRRCLVVDIGGGSVELAVGQSEQLLFADSLRLGVQRLLARVKSPDPLGSKEVTSLEGYIEGVLEAAVRRIKSLGFDQVVGTSGTLRTVGEAAHLRAKGTPWRSLNAQTVSLKNLAALAKELAAMTPAERAEVDRVGEARADAIHLGAVLATRLLALVGADELTLCDASLREGVVWDYLERHPADEHGVRLIGDPRRRSIIELARRSGRDDPREQHVARLALELFDGLAALHGLGSPERELLDYSALLFGIGRHIRYEGRERHAEYIITNSALSGFTELEITLLGLIVRYHRGARPKKSHRSFRALGRTERRVVNVLSGILRVAVALDRGYTQQVKRVVVRTDTEPVAIGIEGSGELEIELLAARSKLAPLERALRRALRVELGTVGPGLPAVDNAAQAGEIAASGSGPGIELQHGMQAGVDRSSGAQTADGQKSEDTA
ncbi:MAG TPA: Ppx/GppA phosphatase family protein [Polyangiaceae bacterium]